MSGYKEEENFVTCRIRDKIQVDKCQMLKISMRRLIPTRKSAIAPGYRYYEYIG